MNNTAEFVALVAEDGDFSIIMYRAEFEKFVLENFGGVSKDFPWEKTPDFAVFRHNDNRKWFALVFYTSKENLMRLKPGDENLQKYRDGEMVEILNLKVDPDLAFDITNVPGILPAYHMNRKYWITVILDENANDIYIKNLTDISYRLTMKKR